MTAPLIVTAELGAADFAFFERLRRQYFPPERNKISAHLTIFHALPASLEPELRQRLTQIASEEPPLKAVVSGLMNLGGGVAFRLVSDALDSIRSELAEAFRGQLTMQDQGGWRPHVTVQNKVTSSVAVATMKQLEADVAPRPVTIAGLAYHHYEGGPWRAGRTFPFRAA